MKKNVRGTMKRYLALLKFFLIFASLCWIAHPASAANTWRVRTGLWTDFQTIQAAINAAANGDTVVVGDGTYSGAGNYNLDFKGKGIVVCSLSGNSLNCIIDCKGLGRGFYFHTGETSASRVSGFTITNGFDGLWGGGGIFCQNASPIVDNCRIVKCVADGNKGGGALSINSSPVFYRCGFEQNKSGDSGAGVAFVGMPPNNTPPIVYGCSFLKNEPTPNFSESFGGGGVWCENSSPYIYYTEFSFNRAVNGGGLACTWNSSPQIYSCDFWHNRVYDTFNGGWGGAIAIMDCSGIPKISGECDIGYNTADYAGGGIALFGGTSRAIIENAYIHDNLSYGFGGGLSTEGINSPQISNCFFSTNRALMLGGGIYCENRGHAKIDRCVVKDNIAYGIPSFPAIPIPFFLEDHTGTGGGIACQNSDAVIQNSVIISNGASIYGGGVACYYDMWDCVPKLVNCTIKDNYTSTQQASGVFCRKMGHVIDGASKLALPIYNSIVWNNQMVGAGDGGPVFNIRNSDIQGSMAAITLVGGVTLQSANIFNMNPLFDPTLQPGRLKSTSPCKDRGDSAWVLASDLDIDGEPRIQGLRVDIGADELPSLLINKPLPY